MQRGIVKWFSDDKGYGFITELETGEEIFVHFTGILSDGFKRLRKNQMVHFEKASGSHGIQAIQVQIVEQLND